MGRLRSTTLMDPAEKKFFEPHHGATDMEWRLTDTAKGPVPVCRVPILNENGNHEHTVERSDALALVHGIHHRSAAPVHVMDSGPRAAHAISTSWIHGFVDLILLSEPDAVPCNASSIRSRRTDIGHTNENSNLELESVEACTLAGNRFALDLECKLHDTSKSPWHTHGQSSCWRLHTLGRI